MSLLRLIFPGGPSRWQVAHGYDLAWARWERVTWPWLASRVIESGIFAVGAAGCAGADATAGALGVSATAAAGLAGVAGVGGEAGTGAGSGGGSATVAGGAAGTGGAAGAGAGVVTAGGADLAGGCSGDPQALTTRIAAASIVQIMLRILHLLVTGNGFLQSSREGQFGNRGNPAAG